MTTYHITSLDAGAWGRSAYGPDYHGDTTADFHELFGGSYGSHFMISAAAYISIDYQYRCELDVLSSVTVEIVPTPDPLVPEPVPGRSAGLLAMGAVGVGILYWLSRRNKK